MEESGNMISITLATLLAIVFFTIFLFIDPLSNSILAVALICFLLSIKIRELYMLDGIYKKVVGKKSHYDYADINENQELSD